jgi:hypothetical protein
MWGTVRVVQLGAQNYGYKFHGKEWNWAFFLYNSSFSQYYGAVMFLTLI